MTIVLDNKVETAEFQLEFMLDAKAEVTTGDDGNVYIEGYASDFGLDRQDEAFEAGAFDAGLKAYMATNPIMLYHHKTDTALGQITEARLDAKGLFVKGRVDAPEPNTPVADLVRKVKNGTLRAFSVGGRFHRRMTPNGPRIFKCDLREISITPLAVNPRTLFAVAGKAFDTTTEDTMDSAALEAIMARLEGIGTLLESAAARNEDAEWEAMRGKAMRVTTEMILHAEKMAAEEGKAVSDGQTQTPGSVIGQGHPDRGHVGLLLMHQQKIATLAENAAQNAKDPEVQKVASDAWKSAKKHSNALHQVAARIGPLPDYYGALA